MIDYVAISLPEDDEGDALTGYMDIDPADALDPQDKHDDEPVDYPSELDELLNEPEPDVWEKWSPDGHASFDRLSESNFDGGGWEQHLTYPAGGGMYPEHRFGKRYLPDGRVVLRPESFMGSDQICDGEGDPSYVHKRGLAVGGYGND